MTKRDAVFGFAAATWRPQARGSTVEFCRIVERQLIAGVELGADEREI